VSSARHPGRKRPAVGAAKGARRAARDLSRSQVIAEKLSKAAAREDPAHVAGAIVIFATATTQRSAGSLAEARGYLDGIRGAIDGLLRNVFKDEAAG
jgi:hypothetical protein